MLFENEEIKTLLKAKSFGENKTIVIEELSELQKEICKDLRGYERREEIKEEMADVYICLQLLKEIYGFTDEELQEEYNRKMDRNIKRIKEKELKKVENIKAFSTPEECIKFLINKKYEKGYILFEQAVKRCLINNNFIKENINTKQLIADVFNKLLQENIIEVKYKYSNTSNLDDHYKYNKFNSKEEAMNYFNQNIKDGNNLEEPSLEKIYLIK